MHYTGLGPETPANTFATTSKPTNEVWAGAIASNGH